jgi:hypothetical protein
MTEIRLMLSFGDARRAAAEGRHPLVAEGQSQHSLVDALMQGLLAERQQEHLSVLVTHQHLRGQILWFAHGSSPGLDPRRTVTGRSADVTRCALPTATTTSMTSR